MGKGHIKNPKLLNCATCGIEFLGRHYKSRFCSRKCCLNNTDIVRNVYVSNKKGKYFKLYGITLEDYDNMILNQRGVCAICKEIAPKLFVDHCHESGIVRGLLCMKCNSALGLFKDNTTYLTSAIQYLNISNELKKVRG